MLVFVSEYVERPSYAFSANWLRDHDANVGEALVFKNVILNEEDVYNNNTGEYSVKVNGTYLFSSTLCIENHNYANMRFVADDIVLGIFRVSGSSWHSCASSTTVAYLSKDTKVRIDALQKSQSNVLYDHTNVMQCSFSGHLIK